jgi:hypothetical protein
MRKRRKRRKRRKPAQQHKIVRDFAILLNPDGLSYVDLPKMKSV